MFARQLPNGRRYGVVAGTGRLLDALERFRGAEPVREIAQAELLFIREFGDGVGRDDAASIFERGCRSREPERKSDDEERGEGQRQPCAALPDEERQTAREPDVRFDHGAGGGPGGGSVAAFVCEHRSERESGDREWRQLAKANRRIAVTQNEPCGHGRERKAGRAPHRRDGKHHSCQQDGTPNQRRSRIRQMGQQRKKQQHVGRQRRRYGQCGAAGAERCRLGEAFAASQRLGEVRIRALAERGSRAVEGVEIAEEARRPGRRIEREQQAKGGRECEKAEHVAAGSASRRVVHPKTIGRVPRFSR